MNRITMSEFWRIIYERCFDSNMTDFSNKIGIDKERLNVLIHGEEEPSANELEKLSCLIGSTTSDIEFWLAPEESEEERSVKRLLFNLFINSIKKKLTE